MVEGLTPEQFSEMVQSLEGAEVARILTLALFGLMVYEYFITLDMEVEYFWKGPWTTSRVLFFLNRYITLIFSVLPIVCFSVMEPSETFCKAAVQLCFLLNIIGISVIQGILVARVWYLFTSNRAIQGGIIFVFLISLISSLYFMYISVNNLRILPSRVGDLVILGCRAERPKGFWRIFLPSLIIHSLLYALTMIRAIRNRRLFTEAPVVNRLVRDGGFLLFVVYLTVGFTSIGSFLKDVPLLNIPAIFSNFMWVCMSIAVSRVLFNLHSLASKIGSDSAWLLSNIELSRVGWKQGSHEGEIIIERFLEPTSPEDEEMGLTYGKKGLQVVRETRVGVLDERTW